MKLEDLSITQIRRFITFYNLHAKIKDVTKKTKEQLIDKLKEHIKIDGDEYYVKQDKYNIMDAVKPKQRKPKAKEDDEKAKEEAKKFREELERMRKEEDEKTRRFKKKDCYDKNFYDLIERLASAKKSETLTVKDKDLRNKLVILRNTSEQSDFYPTPADAIDTIIKDMSEWEKSFNVLEPSCGIGLIIKKLIDASNEDIIQVDKIYGVEYNDDMCNLVKSEIKPQCAKIMCGDFLEIKEIDKDINCIIMNPPFSRGTDKLYYLNHIIHAYILLHNAKKEKYNKSKLLYFICPKLKEQKEDEETIIKLSEQRIKQLEEIWGKNNSWINNIKEYGGFNFGEVNKIGTIEKFSRFNLKAYDYAEQKIKVDIINVKADIYRIFL